MQKLLYCLKRGGNAAFAELKMKGVILAGGYAKRLWPLTKNLAKALLPIAGKPIINYIVEKFEKISEIDMIYVSTNEMFGDQFKEWSKTIKTEKQIKIVVEKTNSEDKKLGAIGGIKFLIDSECITDDILLVGGDNLFGFDLASFVDFYKQKKSSLIAFYDVCDLEKAKIYGVGTLNSKNKVIDFEEKPSKPKSTLASSAVYMFPKEKLDLFKEYLVEGNNKDAVGFFISWLVKKDEVYGFKFNECWYDIGDLDLYNVSNNLYTNQALKKWFDSVKGKLFLIFDMEDTLVKVDSNHFKKVISEIVGHHIDSKTAENFQCLVDLREGMIKERFKMDSNKFWDKFHELEGKIPRNPSIYEDVSEIRDWIKEHNSIMFTGTNPNVAINESNTPEISGLFDYTIFSHPLNGEKEEDSLETVEVFTKESKPKVEILKKYLLKMGIGKNDAVMVVGDGVNDMKVANNLRKEGFNACGVLLMRDEHIKCRIRFNHFFNSGCDIQINSLKQLKEFI